MAPSPRKHPRKNEDINEAAYRFVREATEKHPPERPKNPAAVELGRLGASRGGKGRAAKLSPETRKEIARKAAQTRWARPVEEEVPPPKVL